MNPDVASIGFAALLLLTSLLAGCALFKSHRAEKKVRALTELWGESAADFRDARARRADLHVEFNRHLYAIVVTNLGPADASQVTIAFPGRHPVFFDGATPKLPTAIPARTNLALRCPTLVDNHPPWDYVLSWLNAHGEHSDEKGTIR